MAVNYANLFEDLGVIIRGVNEFRGMATGLPASLSGVITAATQANPGVLTSAAHGLLTGDRIRIDAVVGMVELNDIDYIVVKINANTFSLLNSVTRAPIDTTGFTAYASNGTWVRYRPRPNMVELETDVNNVFTANDTEDVLSGVSEAFDRFKDTVVGWSDQLAEEVVERLTHRETVLEQLPGIGSDSSVGGVLIELIKAMRADTESVQACTVTLGAVAAVAGNSGNGTVLVDKVLDGVTPPHPGFPASLDYAGLNSELAVTSETMVLTCTQDEDSDGLPEGEEIFQWEGSPPPVSGAFDWRTEGSGTNSGVACLNAWQIIANKDFEAWDQNVPESWDLDDGVAGTHVVQEGASADVYRGDYSLKMTGDGAQAEIQISQTLPARILTPQKRYCLACLVKGTAGTAAGTLTIQFESPSGQYVAGVTEKIELNAAALAAQVAYGVESFYLTAPKSIPDDLELVIKITGTLTAAKDVWVDSLAFGPVDYANGVSIVILAGATQFARGDRFTFLVTNDNLGILQTFFRRRFRVQLPSHATTPTQKDTLAS